MKRKSYLKKENPVSRKSCMKTNTFRTVLLYIKKEKLLKRKGRLVFREWFDLKLVRL